MRYLPWARCWENKAYSQLWAEKECIVEISYATTSDIAAIAAVAVACFPPAEAATEKEFVDRVICFLYSEQRNKTLKAIPINECGCLLKEKLKQKSDAARKSCITFAYCIIHAA